MVKNIWIIVNRKENVVRKGVYFSFEEAQKELALMKQKNPVKAEGYAIESDTIYTKDNDNSQRADEDFKKF
jgi:hypothetical protein